ncbi:response regulator transcription factor [bacterium]|nr:response regulator transcription factor [bacterium]
MAKVFIVDDEEDVRDFLEESIKEMGFDSVKISAGAEVRAMLRESQPSLILLDQNMPGKSGLEIIKDVSELGLIVPIIMITGDDSEETKVKALTEGADDYIIKPISVPELRARITAVLRRAQLSNETNESNVLNFKNIKVDLDAHSVTMDGQEVYLTLTEYRLLCTLLKGQGSVLSRDQLRETALGNLNVTDRTIDVHMTALRKKLKPTSESIHTVRGVGYKFEN